MRAFSIFVRACFLVGAMLLAWPAVAADAAGFNEGLLWKIEKGRAAPSYVFGTMHSEDSRVLALPEPVKAAFGGARTFVMEAVMDEQASARMSAQMLFGKDRTLRQMLPDALYGRVVSVMADYSVPEFALRHMKPWAVAMSLSLPKPQTGVFLDLALMRRATAQGKKVAGLETVEEQVAVFDRLSMKEQVTMLEDTLRFLPELDDLFARLHEAYLARDLAGMLRLSEEQEAKGDRALARKVMTQLLDVRNRRMADRMEAYFRQGGAFVAVGALHLPGRTGVLNLLKKRGYRVTQVY